ncbi:MAG: hypothetical protein COU28_00600 [Candidatus Magasanikbacteria bacterium CG10_big_fil_rev_8_21_14_0_10_36_16]|uniref:Type I restriction modification DNA specificity domain-containing protein n=1 Tax=Candidatus Magasanikbacteria bacterium CG10_big_fil_rev_8_21_14_0_10_36_16 TaxID=1974645 RepID=A0A2H0TZI7_9BACT|nr:MAG: hypothetical protein COU28_00600 [Candidatus Magasanikbacteria bacterium CG10_big_fil_rev_8_21_14_0_10_36_16]
MNQKLHNLANIYSGYSFRGAVKNEKDGSHKVVQVRDIESDTSIINTQNLVQLNFDEKTHSPLLQNNDILLSSRGTDNAGLKVGIFYGEEKNIVATSSLFIIRITNKKILPEYLLYYLNSFYGQKDLKSIMMGATIKTISKKELAEMKIPIIETERQKILIDIMKNLIKQKQLHRQKINLLNILTDNIFSTQL